jgi:hypothetical protein
MAMAVGHRDGNTAILDALLEIRPPFNPDDAVRKCVDLARAYRLTRLVSDKFAAEWPVARFSEHGIALDQCARPRSQLYLNFLALANSGRVELLDHGRMLSQFAALQRRTGRLGKDSVDHPRDAHDDLSNATAGVLVEVDLDRRPSLVDQSRLVTSAGAGHVMPATRDEPVIVTLCVGPDGKVGVVYALRQGPSKMLIVDIDVGFFSADFIEMAAARAIELNGAIKLSVNADTMRHVAMMQACGSGPTSQCCSSMGWGERRLLCLLAASRRKPAISRRRSW